MLFFVFFQQQTAYGVRISDWSSDVCSSDLSALSSMLAKPLVHQPWQRLLNSLLFTTFYLRIGNAYFYQMMIFRLSMEASASCTTSVDSESESARVSTVRGITYQ